MAENGNDKAGGNDIPQGYRNIPEEDRRKAKVFFDRGKTVADTGNYEYAIEMYLQGLAIDPDAVDAHQNLREISLKRKASGGKDLGMFQRMGLKKPTKDDKQNMLNAEKALAYGPGDTDSMVSLLQNAHRGGFYDTVIWVGNILQKANADSPKPEVNKFLILKDIYRDLKQFKKASDACNYAVLLRPDDMDLQTEMKNLGAQHTMAKGNYGTAGSFRDSVKDMDKQRTLMEADKDIHNVDALARQITDAEAEYHANPTEAGKLMKLIDVLEKTDDEQYENRAIDLLKEAYATTKQFRFRQRIGKIQMKQLVRTERTKRTALAQNPTDDTLRKDYTQFRTEQVEFELNEFREWAENYPTDMGLKYEMGARIFLLQKFDEAIPVFQQARSDPKYRVDSTILLARSFFETGFVDEASEVLDTLIHDYQLRGDPKSKQMYYWRARALEQKGDSDAAIKLYSQITQWDFNYLDVQIRIKKLRGR